MSNDTTSIFDLPARTESQPQPHATAPRHNNNNDNDKENIKLDIDVDPTMMNKVVHDINQRSNAAASLPQARPLEANPLPSRHIPPEPRIQSLVQDEEARPTHVPVQRVQWASPEVGAPIEHVPARSILDGIQKKKNRGITMDTLTEDMKLPLLLSVLYFLFQVPSVRVFLKRVLPIGFEDDGNPGLLGNGVHSILFALCAYFVVRFQDTLLFILE